MENAPERLLQTVDSLNGSGLVVRRFAATGPVRNDPSLTRLSFICPDKTLGCAQSHRNLAIKASGNLSPILVLEDDVLPREGDIKTLIEDITIGLRQASASTTTESDDNWDVVLFNTLGPGCSGPIGSRPGRFCGSTAAYMLSPQGAKKIAKLPPSWHADLLRNSDALDVRIGPSLFRTRDSEPTGVIFGNRDIAWFGQQPIIRWREGKAIPFWIVGIVVVLTVLGLGFSAKFSSQGRGILSVVIAVTSAIILACILSLAWHTTCDTGYAQCSSETSCFLCGCFVVIVLLSLKCLASGCLPVVSAISTLLSLVCFGLVVTWRDEKRVKFPHNNSRD